MRCGRWVAVSDRREESVIHDDFIDECESGLEAEDEEESDDESSDDEEVDEPGPPESV